MAIATRRPVLDTAGLRSQVRSIESGRDLTRPEGDRDRHRARSIAYRGRRDSGCMPDAWVRKRDDEFLLFETACARPFMRDQRIGNLTESCRNRFLIRT